MALFFSDAYDDARRRTLIEGCVWAPETRPIITTVRLSATKVAQIVNLAAEHDINMLYARPGSPTNLLGQFLEAVLRGRLVPRDPQIKNLLISIGVQYK